ncbi:MAG: bifunctional tetrahydrofolate synthase/dihydrofolate synthase [Gammaproteobacteria bacterium]|nr:bifunctional tetrahydrofolate synthase/dihydrofolate synthase [Gammaproteobacteria bacterium]
MRFNTLNDWLAWQETLHPKAIDLGLERVREVAARMDLLEPAHSVITVAGTNGKGSSVAMLEAILACTGVRVGTYTSPHLWHYNERIRIDGQPIDDAALVAAFDRIDTARGEISLSYFEFGTLAALDLLQRAGVDVAVLEVGLGGRLDAVNILDADCALVTGIGIDHVEWLGSDREAIGREKAGIFRAGRPAVCSDPRPPASLREAAQDVGALWYGLGEQFGYTCAATTWDWWGPDLKLLALPLPAMTGPFQVQNAAGVLMALQALGARVPVTVQALHAGLRAARVPGRFTVVPGPVETIPVETIFDVAHNPHAAAALADALAARPCSGRTLAVCGMLADKDVAGVAHALAGQVQHWYLGGLTGVRGQSAQDLAERMALAAAQRQLYPDMATAYAAALAQAQPGDRVVVFGSFHTIAELLPTGL